MQDQSIEFVNPKKIPTILECIICTNFFEDAVRLRCGHVFCEDCVNQWFENKEGFICPVDRKNIQPLKGEVYQPDILTRNILDEFDRYCSNRNKGCLQAMKKKDLEQHLLSCEYSDKKQSQDFEDMIKIDRSEFKTQKEYEEQIQQHAFMINFCSGDNKFQKAQKKNQLLETLLDQKDYENDKLIDQLLQENIDQFEENEENIQNDNPFINSIYQSNKHNDKMTRKQKNKQIQQNIHNRNNQRQNEFSFTNYFLQNQETQNNLRSPFQNNFFDNNCNGFTFFQRLNNEYQFQDSIIQLQQIRNRQHINPFRNARNKPPHFSSIDNFRNNQRLLCPNEALNYYQTQIDTLNTGFIGDTIDFRQIYGIQDYQNLDEEITVNKFSDRSFKQKQKRANQKKKEKKNSSQNKKNDKKKKKNVSQNKKKGKQKKEKKEKSKSKKTGRRNKKKQ